MSSVSGMLNWMGICITFLRFRAGLKVGIYDLGPHKQYLTSGM